MTPVRPWEFSRKKRRSFAEPKTQEGSDDLGAALAASPPELVEAPVLADADPETPTPDDMGAQGDLESRKLVTSSLVDATEKR
jgi:hypothetical protein